LIWSIKTFEIVSVVFPKPAAALMAILWGNHLLGILEGSRACTIEPQN